MKTYKAKLKHDKGIVYLRVLAENEQEAIRRICDSELCPERAIEKIIEINKAMRTTNESIKFYLGMVDNGSNTIYLQQENGTNNIKTTNGNQLIFSGTKKEVYNFLVGLYRIMCL